MPSEEYRTQGSVLGALLFNIYLNDLFMFLEETEICNYADDTTIYACGPNIENVIMHLENDVFKITEGFPNNFGVDMGDEGGFPSNFDMPRSFTQRKTEVPRKNGAS